MSTIVVDAKKKKEHPQKMYERGSLPTDKIPAKKSLGHFSYPILGCHKIPFRDFFKKKIDFYQELFDTFSILTWINFTILGSFFESLNSHKMV